MNRVRSTGVISTIFTNLICKGGKREDPLRLGTATKVAAEPSGPRPALVRISLPKQRPRRRGHLLETIRAPPSDVYPYPKIFCQPCAFQDVPCSAPHRQTAWPPSQADFRADLPRLPAQATLTNPLGQKARGPLRPRIPYRGRDQSRADPRPAGVRVSLPKQRPKRGERLWQILRIPSSDVYPYLRFFARSAPSRTRPARTPPAAVWPPPPTDLQTDRRRPPVQAAFTNPLRQKARGPLRPQCLYRDRDQSRADPRPAWVRVSLQSSDLSGASTRGRRYALRPVTSTHVRKFFASHAPSRTHPAQRPSAGPLGHRFHTDHPRPPVQAAFTDPIYSGKKRGVRRDLNASTEVDAEAERTHGLPGCASRCKAAT